MLPAKINLPATTGRVMAYMTEQEINRLTETWQDYADNPTGRNVKHTRRYFVLFLFLRFTGARISEILGIKDDDIDTRAGTVRIRTLKQRKGKNANRERTVPIPQTLIAEYLKYTRDYPADRNELVFKGVTRNNFWSRYNAMAGKAGIKEELRHPHTLRHTRAMELLRAGMPITAVRNLLGHASIETTAIYLNIGNAETAALMREKGLI